MIFEWIVFGGIAFWILTGVAAALVIACAVNDNDGPAVAFVALWAAIYALFGDGLVFDWIASNPSKMLMIVAAYFVGGTVWALYQWIGFVRKKAGAVAEYREEYVRVKADLPSLEKKIAAKHNLSAIEAAVARTAYGLEYEYPLTIGHTPRPVLKNEINWNEEFAKAAARHVSVSTIPLRAYDYKSCILSWMVWWPFTAVWAAINDPIRGIFRFIQTSLNGIFQRVSDRTFGKIMDGDL